MTDSHRQPLERPTDDANCAPPRYTSEQLFGGMRHVVIVHGTREYSLRLTATNKLILTA
jgi:hemin uptake protein HemP